MKVYDVMTKDVMVCGPETSLAEAAIMMWDRDCGVLPVVDEEGRILAMITDRDIAIAAATHGRPAHQIAVREAMSRRVLSARFDEDLGAALKTMRHDKIRRLPVVDNEGRLKGIVTINDIVCRAAEPHGAVVPEITYEDAMSTIKAISEHLPHRAAARA